MVSKASATVTLLCYRDTKSITRYYILASHRHLNNGVNTQYLNCDYDGEMTIQKAYEYLKTIPQYEGAEDI